MSQLSSPKKNFFPSKTLKIIPSKSFSTENLDRSLNLLIYGLIISKHYKSAKFFHRCVFYILEDDSDYLQWLSNLKPYNKTRIDLKSIKNITDDPHFDSKIQKKFQKYKEFSRLLFISYDDLARDTKVLILKFQKEETKFLFWQGIQHLSRKAIEKEANFGDFRKVLAQKLFLKADKDGNKTLDFEETKKILQKLHIEINHDFLIKFFNKYDKDKNKAIDWSEFQDIIDDISLKSELKAVFKKYCKDATNLNDDNAINTAKMEFNEFEEFLLKEQKQEITEIEFKKLLHLFHDDKTNNFLGNSEKELSFEVSNSRDEKSLTFSEFCSFLFSPKNEIFEPEKQEIYHDMTRPLSDYFINSSHNTYLLANQLTGESSTKAYINAFARGCRCVELDCWEGEKGEPIIYHGYTFTSKISFRDVVQTIKDYAFVSSPYPVILSIENHCKEKQQDKMAEIFKEILGDMLYILPVNYQEHERLPSPEHLKYKVLIKDKAKLPNAKKFGGEFEMLDQRSTLEWEDEERYLKSKEVNLITYRIIRDGLTSRKNSFFPEGSSQNLISLSQPPVLLPNSMSSHQINLVINSMSQSNYKNLLSGISQSLKMNKSANLDESSVCLDSPEKSQKKKISPILQKLLAFYGIKMDLMSPRSIWNVSSIKEPVFEKLTKDHEDQFQDFLRTYLLRLYPAGTRVDSSNYDPMLCFTFGVQMIALNVQTVDLPLLLYMSKFRENGGANCGYLLKPQYLLNETQSYIRKFTQIRKIICLEVITGQQLRPENEEDVRDVVDPYVEVLMRGIPVDEKENVKVYKSQIVNNNGFNPSFNLQCQFKLYCPDMAMIIFKVFDQELTKKDVKIGWNAVSVGCLRVGYRTVPLMNSHLNEIEFSCLFCKVEIKDVVVTE